MSHTIPNGFSSEPAKGGEFLKLLIKTVALAEIKGLRGTEYKTNGYRNKYTIGFYEADKRRPVRGNLCMFSTKQMSGDPGFSKDSTAYEELSEVFQAIKEYGDPVEIPSSVETPMPTFPSLSPDPSSADIGLDGAFTRVRGGGLGGGAWIARIKGEHSEYKFERDWCRKCTSGLSGSGRSGIIEFDIPGPGLYEFKGFCVGSTKNNSDWSGFILLRDDGRRFMLPKTAAELFVQKKMGQAGGSV